MPVLDLSRYDESTYDPACLLANGVEGVILASHPEGTLRTMAAQARAAGLPIIGFYGFVYFSGAGHVYRDIVQAVRLAKNFGVERVWIDCEADAMDHGWASATRPTIEQRLRGILDAVTVIEQAGLSAGIYTGSWWWMPNAGNSWEFARLPLWHSAYGANDGSQPPIRTVSYGGWTDVAIHQYTSTYPVCGRNRDANYVFEEDAMTPAERAEMDAIIKHLGGAQRIVDIDNAATVDALNAAILVERERIDAHIADHSHNPTLNHTHVTGGPQP